MFWVWVAHDVLALAGYADRRTIPSLLLARLVNLVKHRVVDVRSECVLYRIHIDLEAVGRQLYPVGEARGQIVNENLGRLPVTISDHKRRHQLRVRINRYPP